MIGIIGGIGPHAGLHLHRLILERSKAHRDQDHLPVIHISLPAEIPDRTEFLLGNVIENPADSITRQIKTLWNMGANVVGLPCNTAHAPAIYNSIFRNAEDLNNLILVNMVDELFRIIKKEGKKRIGLLCTNGSYRTKLFEEYANQYEVQIATLEPKVQSEIHNSIYNGRDGLKKTGFMTKRIENLYKDVIRNYEGKNVDAMILGCTEISMVYNSEKPGFRTYNTLEILADALIEEYKKLKG